MSWTDGRDRCHAAGGPDTVAFATKRELAADMIAVGRLGDPFTLPEDLRDRETELRRREPLAALLLG